MVANGLEGVPWMVGGGAKHSANVGRLVAYAATGGAAGVIRPGDLKVSASGTPDNLVHMATGAVAIPNRYPAARSESYLARGVLVSDIPVPGLGGGTNVNHLVVVRIEDPQFGGQAPASVADGPYGYPEIYPNVPANTTRAEQIPALANKPYYALARIDLPAGATTVQQGYIKDLRKLSTPHYEPFNDLKRGPTTPEQVLVGDTAWKNWPSALVAVDVPIWATHADVEIVLNGLHVEGAADADTRINLGGLTGPSFSIDYNGSPGTAAGFVETLQHRTQAKFDVATLAGQNVNLRLNAQRMFPANTGRIEINSLGQISYRIEFFERPL